MSEPRGLVDRRVVVLDREYEPTGSGGVAVSVVGSIDDAKRGNSFWAATFMVLVLHDDGSLEPYPHWRLRVVMEPPRDPSGRL